MNSHLDDESVDYSTVSSWLERKAVALIFKFLLKKQAIRLVFDSKNYITIGQGPVHFAIAPPRLTKMILALTNPRYLACEYYTQGLWYCIEGDVKDLILSWQEEVDGHLSKYKFFHEIKARTNFFIKQYLKPIKSTRETKHHYNTSHVIYESILGETMAYSCAFFDNTNNLDQAQKNKFNLTTTRLSIKPQDNLNVLDIGCGWGSYIFYLLNKTKCNIDGITISSNQVDYANKLKAKLNSKDQTRTSIIESDYLHFKKENSEIYDRIVSIGMLEHVGKTQYNIYFKNISRLLKPGGIGLVHTITSPLGGVPNMWVDKYIFPGGYIPKISEVIKGIEHAGLTIEAIHRCDGINYAKTLSCWRDNFIKNYKDCSDSIKQTLMGGKNRSMLGESADIEKEHRKIMRIWFFYLSSLQTMFIRSHDQCNVCQFVIKKNN